MANEVYQNLSMQLATDGELNDFATRHICEYLSKNIKGLEDFSSTTFGDSTRVHLLETNGGCSFTVWQEILNDVRGSEKRDLNTKDGEFHGATAGETKSLVDAISAEEEVIHFHSYIELKDDQCLWAVSKEQFNKAGAYEEMYYPGMMVRTTIYSLTDYMKAVMAAGNLSTDSASIVYYPIMSLDRVEQCRSVVATCNPINTNMICEIVEYEGEKAVDSRRTIGKSVYSAYYDYMVEKGYFTTDGIQKHQ